jgi:hypothetical protein
MKQPSDLWRWMEKGEFKSFMIFWKDKGKDILMKRLKSKKNEEIKR